MTAPADDRASYFSRLHARLRLEGDSPRRRAAAVALGTLIGCQPVYGLHLALTTLLARWLGLSRVLTYLAAHVNNPLTAPLILYVEQGLGHWLIDGRWPELSWGRVRSDGVLGLGLDLVLGSLTLGIALGLTLGVVTLVVASRRRPDPYLELCETAAEPFLRAGVVHWEWVRGKLRHDPVFRSVLEGGGLPSQGRLVDLGCGRGPLLALVAAARDRPNEGSFRELELCGVELRPRLVQAARTGLGERATVVCADLLEYSVPRCHVALLLDVLHYLPAAAQENLLARVGAALHPGGVLLIREADAAAGWRFSLTRWAERLAAVARGHFRQPFAFRPLDEWRGLLESRGFSVSSRPMSDGTPFGNVLLVASKPEETS